MLVEIAFLIIAGLISRQEQMDGLATGGNGHLAATRGECAVDPGHQGDIVLVIEKDPEMGQRQVRSSPAEKGRKTDGIPFEFVGRERKAGKVELAEREIDPFEIEAVPERDLSRVFSARNEGVLGARGHQCE